MTQRIVIVGAGGHARDLLDVFEACNAVEPGAWDVVGYVSEVVEEHGRTIRGLTVLGGWEWFGSAAAREVPDLKIVCAVGDSPLRQRLVGQAEALGLEFVSVVHPAAVVPPDAVVGKGVLVSAGALTTSSMWIGDHVILNLGCTVAHDAVLGDFCTLAPGVHVSGHVRMGAGCDLGTGAVVLPRIEIGAWTVVGAGAVVTQNLPSHVTAVGVPARIIKTRSERESL